ncbi:UNVERIFIED_CONTAM: protein NLP7 [Sesamum latifolium]|uniref:Protein NLP7 n=1 Tax=Sesamum latifolium TaxID=2727402 RepID=A0AAW2TCV1_9LAMI
MILSDTGDNIEYLSMTPCLPDNMYRGFLSDWHPPIRICIGRYFEPWLASGKQLVEELVVEVISFVENDEFTSFELHQPDMLPVRFEVTQFDKEPRCQHWTNQSVHDTPNGHDSSKRVSKTEPDDAASADLEEGVIVTAKKTKGESNTTSFHLRYEDLQLHFGKGLQDVEKELGVSRSTLKRACRDYGIKRMCYKVVELRAIKNRTKLAEDGVVMIKAKFGDEIVKVQLLLSSGIEKLKEEVGKRFNLMNESFKLYYLDDNEWIVLACDDDLQLCMKTSTASGKTPIQILVK